LTPCAGLREKTVGVPRIADAIIAPEAYAHDAKAVLIR
jgi:hypothetical protein